MSAIFGYTGFVGNYLTKFYKCDYFYNSSNINDAKNKNFNTIFISCIPSVKWLANKEPINDSKIIDEIKNILKTISADKVILISTIDVYHDINNKLNEDNIINYKTNHTYGKNRYLFEEFIKSKFSNVLIIRLPALFGNRLKKNIIYDLLNNNDVDKIYINSSFQWYNLEWIKEDIDTCLKYKITECNLFSEPLETQKIIQLFPEYNYTKNPTKLFNYDVTTNYYKYFSDGNNGYIRNKELIYNDLKKFILKRKIQKNFKLCVSNISNHNLKNEQYYSILKHYDVDYLEIAPTKFNTWQLLLNNNYFAKEKKQIEKFGIVLYSFQSITYTIENNIFDKSNQIIFEHLKNVIDFAIKYDVENLVFGCPKNRTILNFEENNDIIFVDFFRKLGNYIGNRNLIISIENNSKKYNCNYLNTIKEVGQIVTKINHSKIKMMIDIGNCIMDNDNIENLSNYIDLINHIHISMPFMNLFIDYNKKEYYKFICLLKKINYNKVISLEFLNTEENQLKNICDSLENFTDLLI